MLLYIISSVLCCVVLCFIRKIAMHRIIDILFLTYFLFLFILHIPNNKPTLLVCSFPFIFLFFSRSVNRELVRQTYEVVTEFCDEISKTPGYPKLRIQLVIGGEPVRDQLSTYQTEGIHCGMYQVFDIFNLKYYVCDMFLLILMLMLNLLFFYPDFEFDD